MSTPEPPIQVTLSNLVGHWRATHGPLTIDWVFASDGTFTAKIMQGKGIISDCTGTWFLDGISLTCIYKSDSCGVMEIGYRDRDTFIEFASGYFVVRTTGTGNRRYTRVE